VLENLPTDTLPRLLRRTTLSAIIVGVVGFVVTIFVAPLLAALGVVIGVGMAIANLRFLDGQTAKSRCAASRARRRFAANWVAGPRRDWR